MFQMVAKWRSFKEPCRSWLRGNSRAALGATQRRGEHLQLAAPDHLLDEPLDDPQRWLSLAYVLVALIESALYWLCVGCVLVCLFVAFCWLVDLFVGLLLVGLRVRCVFFPRDPF